MVGGCQVIGSMTAVFGFEDRGSLTGRGSLGKVFLEGFQVWLTNGSRMDIGARDGFHGQGNRAAVSVSLGRWVSVFQAEVYALAVCSSNNGSKDNLGVDEA